ncbi:MAG TPA: glutamyl-tRNA reductase [Gemmatimonadaceae bacterium]|nr:glutamyl-tRNA reductase [Gemmatimonadaceae bacterium]
MALTVVGINHRGAALDIRERIAYQPSEIGDALAALCESTGLQEAVVVSTCNRTELYVVEDDRDAVPALWAELSQRLGAEASGFGYVRRDREAVAHLFRVASGLDSMVLGEAQIHGQVRDAWELCRAHSGPVLNRLFQTSLLVAGRVRNETSVGRGAASVSSAAVQIAKQIFGSLANKRAMVLGAGEMAELALECLRDQGVRTAIVANRTYEKAVEVAARHGAAAMHYDECWAALRDVDVLVCSTAAPHAVVSVDHIRPALDARGQRPLCVLDIALPRDVEPAVGELSNVFLYNLDDLQAVVSANLQRRRGELPTAEELIAGEVGKYWDWLAGLSAVPVLRAMRDRMEELRRRELADALRKLDSLPPEQRAVVEELSRTLMNKFLHEPSVRLRAAAANGRGLGVVDTVRYLFGLEQTPPAAPDSAPDSASSGQRSAAS